MDFNRRDFLKGVSLAAFAGAAGGGASLKGQAAGRRQDGLGAQLIPPHIRVLRAVTAYSPDSKGQEFSYLRGILGDGLALAGALGGVDCDVGGEGQGLIVEGEGGAALVGAARGTAQRPCERAVERRRIPAYRGR